MDSPTYFTVSSEDFPFELDKADDLNDEEAPRLVKKEVGPESKPEKKILKIPNTVTNLGVLFQHPKNGNPSTYAYVSEAISDQHGNKRIPAGRICMRESVIGRNLSFAQQQAVAAKSGVVIPQLGHRILFDFLRQAEAKTYPDGQDPWTFARTSTLIVGLQETPLPVSCGDGGPPGLYVTTDSFFAYESVGVALALPAEVQAIDP